MEKVLSDRLKIAGLGEVAALIDEKWPDIMADMDRAYIQFCQDNEGNDKARFAFKVGLGLELVPAGEACTVYGSIRWNVTRKDETDGRMVDGHPELPGLADD